LIPILKNSDNLNFLYSSEMNLDASLSYDEALIADASMNKDPLLKFQWICPDKIQDVCKDITKNILNLQPESLLLLQDKVAADSSIFTFGLNITKQSRSNFSSFFVTISK